MKLHCYVSRFQSFVLWVKYSSTWLNTVIQDSTWRCKATSITWKHHNCTLSLTNGLCRHNVVSGGVPFYPYNTQEDTVSCSSRTSECPPAFCFKRILGLKSIPLLTPFVPDLLACQFAMPNWVQLNCDLAVAYVTMWPKALRKGLCVCFLQSCREKPITAHHEHGWVKLSSAVLWKWLAGLLLVESGNAKLVHLQETTQLNLSLTIALLGLFAVILIQLHCPYIISGHLF